MARRIILIVIALLISGGAIFLAQQWLRGSAATPHGPPTDSHGAPPPMVQVLVAHGDLYAGQFIRPESLTWQPWPPGPLPDSYFVEGKARAQDFVGSVVRSRIAKGEPISLGKIVRPGDRGFMAAVLNPGERAVTVNVTASTGLAGFVFPGDRVDLLLTMSLQPVATQTPGSTPAPAGITRHVSETILRNVRIVGMDQSFTDGKKDDKTELSVPKTATLEVSPKQAEIIAVATDLGVLSMALRSVASDPKDDMPGPISRTWDVDATQIAFASHPAGVASTPHVAGGGGLPRWTVEVVRGAGSTETAAPAAPSAAPAEGERGRPAP